MKTKFPAFLLLLFLMTACQAQTKGVDVIPPQAYAEKIKTTPNAQIFDVRTPMEFSSEHLNNAVNINWNGDDFAVKASEYDKSKPVFIYCKTGGRSGQAAKKLHEMGFTQVYDLQGGIMKWNAAGLSKPDGKMSGMTPKQYDNLLQTDKKVLVNFYAEWCAPCKKMTPYMVKMEKEWADSVTIVRLNADENKTLIADMKIDELPALLLYKDGKVVWQHRGFISETDLKSQLQ